MKKTYNMASIGVLTSISY